MKPGFDLDEDLFDFDEILDVSGDESSKVDLDELLKALEESEESADGKDVPADELDAAADVLIGVADDLVPESPAARPTQEQPTPVPAAGSALSGRFVRIGFLLIAGLGLLNVIHLALSWERGRDLSRAMVDLEGRFLAAAGDLQQSMFQQTEAMERNRLPVVAPDSVGRESLADIVRQIEAGLFDEARRRIYGLLAVTDRYEPVAAREIEASAMYLLADSWRLEAEAAAEQEGGR